MFKVNKYPASKILLELAYKEYDVMNQRRESFYSRTNTILTFIIALIFYGILNSNIFEIFKICSNFEIQNISFFKIILPGFCFILFILLLISLSFCIYYSFATLFIKEAKGIDLDAFTLEQCSRKENDVTTNIVCTFNEILESIEKNNIKRAKNYKTLLICASTSVLFFIILSFLIKLC